MSNVSVPPLYDGAVQQFHIKDSQVSVDALNHNAVRFIMAATTLGFNSSIALVSNHNGTNYANNYPRGTIFSGSVLGGGYAGTWISLGAESIQRPVIIGTTIQVNQFINYNFIVAMRRS